MLSAPNADLPNITSARYVSALYEGNGLPTASMANMGMGVSTLSRPFSTLQQLNWQRFVQPGVPVENLPVTTMEKQMSSRRIVQVFIADPDESVPLDQAVLYRGSQHLTELTDEELFFELELKSLLVNHNATRATIINKKVKDRVEYLEPVKVRDLKMVVVTVASF